MGLNQRNAFSPIGNFQKIRLPNSKIKLRWPRPETRGKVDIDKLEENFRQILDQLDENSTYLNRTDWGNASGTRWATIVIAASDSTGLNKASADFTCGGSGDATVINTAIALLELRPATVPVGRIVLLEGTYNLGGEILVDTLGARLLVIQGMGAGGHASTIGATKLVAAGPNSAFSLGGNSAAAGSTVILEGLHITSSASAPAIDTRDMVTIVRGCSIVTSGLGGGITQTNSTGTGGGSRYLHNIIECPGGGAGITSDVGAGLDEPIIISGNKVKVVGNVDGISCGNSASTIPSYVVSDNYVVGSTTASGIGINLRGNSIEDCTVTGNVVKNIGTCIQAAGYRHTISGNVASGCADGIRTGPDSQFLAILANHVTGYSGTAFLLTNNAIRPTVIGNKASNGGASACTIAAGVTNAFVGYNDFGGGTVTDNGTTSTVVTPLPPGGAANFVLKKLSATTGDYDWALDPSIDAITGKGALLVGTAVDALLSLGVGKDEALLTPDATQTTGLKWSRRLFVQDTDPALVITPDLGDIWIDTT